MGTVELTDQEKAHDARWRNARRTALLRDHQPAWWFARLIGRGGRKLCQVCGFNRQSPTTGCCGWCGSDRVEELVAQAGSAAQRARRKRVADAACRKL